MMIHINYLEMLPLEVEILIRSYLSPSLFTIHVKKAAILQELKYLQLVRRQCPNVFNVSSPPRNFPTRFFKTYSKTTGMIIGPSFELLSRNDEDLILNLLYLKLFKFDSEYIWDHVDGDFRFPYNYDK